jgi:hypothetical protein
MLKLTRLALSALVAVAVCAWTAQAQETKQESKKGGTGRVKRAAEPPANSHDGTIVKVDKEKKTVTVKDEDNKDHDFTIDEHVKVQGPQGGKVSGLDDERFVKGFRVHWTTDKDGKLKTLTLARRSRGAREIDEKAAAAKAKVKAKVKDASKDKDKDKDSSKDK